MPLTIRKLTANDKELFLSFLQSFYHSEAVLHPTDSKLHLNIFNEIIRSENYLLCYVFEYDKKNAGYALLSKSFCPEVGGSIVWIEQLYINEEHRQKGIAKELLSFIERK